MREPDADHHDTLARVHWRAGQLVEAEEKARRAIELAPDNANYHDTLALVLGDAGRLDDAEDRKSVV